jgi:TPR repeat protein
MARTALIFSFALVGIFLLAACFHRRPDRAQNPAPLPEAAAAQFDLPRSERKQLAVIAPTNSFAAFRLYEYYQIAHYDQSNAMYWLFQSANQGNPKAEYSLGNYLTFLPGYIDLIGAKQWLRLAAAQGDPDAARELKQLEAQGK